MGLFSIFSKKEKHISEEELKVNKMWKLWEEGKAESPYAELMTYQSEVNNGGHLQYFDNLENVGDLQKEVSQLNRILPQILKDNLLKAYNAYLVMLKQDQDDETEIVFEKYDEEDDDFDLEKYQNEESINQLLEKYSETIEL